MASITAIASKPNSGIWLNIDWKFLMVKNLPGKNIDITIKTLIIMINKVNVFECFEYLLNK